MTTAQAANRLKCGENQCARLCRDGQLRGAKRGLVTVTRTRRGKTRRYHRIGWAIPMAAVHALLAARRKAR